MATVFDKAKVRLLLDEPFYATLMMHMKLVECEKTPGGQDLWLAATNGETMFINPVNFEELSVPKGVFVLKHEIMHVGLLHPYRKGDREGKRANEAMDYVINDMMHHEGNDLVDNVLHNPSQYNRHMAWEEVYNLLPEQPEGEKGSGQGKPGDGGNPLDDDVMPAPDQSKEAQAEAVERVVQAAHIAKAMGKLPGWAKSFLGDLLEPKVDWTEQLARFLTEVTENDYSFAKPNRRFVSQGLYLPGKYGNDGMGYLAVVFDTSGSVSMEEMTRFASEVVEAVQSTEPVGLALIYCDAEVQHHDLFDHPTKDEVMDSLHRYGCGGTDMTAALDWIDDNLSDVKATIVFTDGYTPFGLERSYPTLWAVTTKGLEADMGETVYVEV
jgi:predicted metal-dependent peptidase